MSRYIKVDKAMELCDAFYFTNETCSVEWLFKNAPSIDIVRCQECIHNPWNEDCDYTCVWDDDFADRPQTPDDFCSYGERRTDE